MATLTRPGAQALAGLIAAALTGGAQATWYLGWGTGVTPEDTRDVALAQELRGPRVRAEASLVTTTVPGDTLLVEATLVAREHCVVTEAGVFDAPEGGRLIGRQRFGGNTLEAGDQLTLLVSLELVPDV